MQYNRIKVILAEKDLKNNALAERVGVNAGTVSAWTNNRQQPSVEKLFKIAAALGVDVRELLNPKAGAAKVDQKTIEI